MASPTNAHAIDAASAGDALRALLASHPQHVAGALGIASRVAPAGGPADVLRAWTEFAAGAARADSGLLYVADDEARRLDVRAATSGQERWVDSHSVALDDVGDGAERHPDAERLVTGALTCRLVSPSGRIVGVLALHTSRQEGFGDDDAAAAELVASLATTVVETMHLRVARDRQLDVLSAFGGLGDALASPAASSRALHRLAVATAGLLDARPVAIYVRDASCFRLTTASTSLGQVVSDAIPLGVLGELLDAGEPCTLSGAACAELWSVLGWADRDRAASAMLVPIRAGDETVGFLVANDGALRSSDSDRLLLRTVATVAAMIVQAGRAVERLAARHVELAFLETLSGGTEPLGVVTARARGLGVDLAERHVAAVFNVLDPGAGQADPEAALERLRAVLMERFPSSAAARRGLELLAVLRVQRAVPIVDRTQDAVELIEARDGITLIGGLSGPTSGAASLGAAFVEARDAVSIGKAMRPLRRVIEYDNLGALRHLWALASSPTRDATQEQVELLRAHDEEHGTQLLETLEAYLEEQGSRELASAQSPRPSQHVAAASRADPAAERDRSRRPRAAFRAPGRDRHRAVPRAPPPTGRARRRPGAVTRPSEREAADDERQHL